MLYAAHSIYETSDDMEVKLYHVIGASGITSPGRSLCFLK